MISVVSVGISRYQNFCIKYKFVDHPAGPIQPYGVMQGFPLLVLYPCFGSGSPARNQLLTLTPKLKAVFIESSRSNNVFCIDKHAE